MKTPRSVVAGEPHGRAAEDGDIRAADSAFRWAIGLDPSNPIHMHAAASAALRAGRQDEAETLFRRALTDTVATFGPSHPHMVTVASGLVEICETQGRTDEARHLCREIVEGVNLKVAAMANSRTLKRFADLCLCAGVPRRAIALYMRAVRFRCRLYGKSHPMIAEYMAGLIELLHETGDPARAAALRKRTMEQAPSSQEG